MSLCPNFTFQGYFGRSQEIMKAYPYGGLCQYITAPADALVVIPEFLDAIQQRIHDAFAGFIDWAYIAEWYGLGLVLLVCLIVYLMGGFRART